MRLRNSILAAGLLPMISAASSTSTTSSARMLRGQKVVHTRTVTKRHALHIDPHHHSEPLVDRQKPASPPPSQPAEEHHHFVKIRGTRGGVAQDAYVDLDVLEDILPHGNPIFEHFHHHFHSDDEPQQKNVPPKKAQPQQQQQRNPAKQPKQKKPTQEETRREHIQQAKEQTRKAKAHVHQHKPQQTKEEPRTHAPPVAAPTADRAATRQSTNVPEQDAQAHHGSRSDRGLHQGTHEHHFEAHERVEKHREQHHYHPHESKKEYQQSEERTYINEEEEQAHRREMYALPTGFSSFFNETLFEELHDAPFRVYEEALNEDLEDGESFPVFFLPDWKDSTGVFTGFAKTGTPLIFENAQTLLPWKDIVAASSGASHELTEFIEDNHFRASLIIGKSVGNGANVPFLGVVVSYYQHGSRKTVMVPFSKLEDFFDDTSEKTLLSDDTKALELEALHELLEGKRSNSSSFYHPALAHTDERKARLEDLEIVHFQKLFQLLIRRSFLFSFGYADCLLHEPEHLRDCLDDTFYHVIQMETSVRGALDDEVLEELAEINQTFHARVSEACVYAQGSGVGVVYGSGSCYEAADLSAFLGGASYAY